MVTNFNNINMKMSYNYVVVVTKFELTIEIQVEKHYTETICFKRNICSREICLMSSNMRIVYPNILEEQLHNTKPVRAVDNKIP